MGLIRIIGRTRSRSFSERLEASVRRIVMRLPEGDRSAPEADLVVAEMALILDHLGQERAAAGRTLTELQDKRWSSRLDLKMVLHTTRYQPFPPEERDPILKRLDRIDRDERGVRESALSREHAHHTRLLELIQRHAILTGEEPWMPRD